ncbi:hypothetical protein DM02DRAFT_608673 [Periconia macrospinosa]|uniref:Uncharacterized protein n=1 Tax=Periconia macrospinosa TaxID=97972 RepID=A0A2V1EBT1_9PLEO|nr:hypothetical protein DM02DRAFT_608673 [Periconia macrospinosa]
MPNSPSPPPPPFAFTLRNFDYPQASSSPPPPAPRSRPPPASRILGQRQRERHRQTAAERDDDPAERVPLITRARRRELAREARRPVPPHAQRDASDALIRRSRDLLGERHSLLAFAASATLNPFDVSHSRRDRSPTSEIDDLLRQPKRRKLVHDNSSVPEYDGFKYGYKGQVVPGRLNMSIVTCDGGEFEKHNPERLYKVQNVLRNDKSVYCSEDSRCNLLLKHQGDTPFCLEKVVIRAPDRGFTAPVQEGLVFVSLSPDDLISRTASYKIDYNSQSPAASPSPSSSDDQLLSLREALVDPQIWSQSHQDTEEPVERPRLRHQRRRPRVIRGRRQDQFYGGQQPPAPTEPHDYETSAENCPYYVDDGELAPAGVAAPTPPPFTVTTEDEQDDSADANETMPTPAIMADRLRRESRWRPDSDDEDDDGESAQFRMPLLQQANAQDSWENFRPRRWGNSRRDINPIRATRLRTPSRIEPEDDETGSSEGLIQPHARFFIARHKNKITIKFHPAVSGKYVLLKLWSPTSDGNIDIESVQFYGYSGPRFFPAVQTC